MLPRPCYRYIYNSRFYFLQLAWEPEALEVRKGDRIAFFNSQEVFSLAAIFDINSEVTGSEIERPVVGHSVQIPTALIPVTFALSVHVETGKYTNITKSRGRYIQVYIC